jgi:hypothetical protein
LLLNSALAALPDPWRRVVILRDVDGRPPAEVSAAIGLTAEQQRDMANWRGYVQSAWQTIRDATAGGAPKLVAAVADAEQGFIQKLQPHTDAIVKAGAAGTAYPMSVQQWFDVSNPALELIVRIKDAAVDVTTEYAAMRATSAEMRLILAIVLTVIGIAISAFSIWVVVAPRRPATALAMTTAMRRSGRGDTRLSCRPCNAPTKSAKWPDRFRCSRTMPSRLTRWLRSRKPSVRRKSAARQRSTR